jgi:hypothetical protein
MDKGMCSASDLAEVFSRLETADPQTLAKVQVVIDQLRTEKQKQIDLARDARVRTEQPTTTNHDRAMENGNDKPRVRHT